MIEQGGHKKPEVYESMEANKRFVALAREVIQRQGEDPNISPDDGPITVILPKDKSGDTYRIQKGYIGSPFGAIYTAYVLEHLESGQTETANRYMVAIDEDSGFATPIYPVNQHNSPLVPLDPVQSRTRLNEAAQTSLQVLSAYAPETAAQLLREQFDKSYDKAVGSYILSDYAVEDMDEELGPEAAQAALQKFHEQVKKIGRAAIEKSRKRKPVDKYPQPAYRDAVAEAAERGRESDGRNRYRIVEYGRVVVSVARDIKKWTNKVSLSDKFGKNAQAIEPLDKPAIIEDQTDISPIEGETDEGGGDPQQAS